MRFWVFVFIFLGGPALALSEGDYVKRHCTGQIEFQLWDGTRVDCLLEEEAQEYDWGRKYHEAIGQALWYAMNTGRQAVIVLIVESNSDARGVMRARRIIAHYGLPIRMEVIHGTE